MIVDTLDNISRYAGLNAGLAKGLEYLRSAGASLADGRHEIDGEKVFARVSSYRTREKSSTSFEAHRRYIDVQCLLAGRETLYWMPEGQGALLKEYSVDKDVELRADEERDSAVLLEPGSFAMLFPGEPHLPGCHYAGPEDVRKIVIKVLMW